MQLLNKNKTAEKIVGEKIEMMKEHIRPVMPMPPHERKEKLYLEFDDEDWKVLQEIFEDEDTAVAAAEIIRAAPPEIQILATQLIYMIEEVN